MANFGDDRLPRRFWSKCFPEPNSGCWLWFGASVPKGYGLLAFRLDGKQYNAYAHRLTYETFIARIPAGLQIDHKCRITCCCNPLHLEPVTSTINILRGNNPDVTRARHAAITHCPHGHEYTEPNTKIVLKLGYQTRVCRACLAACARRRRAA